MLGIQAVGRVRSEMGISLIGGTPAEFEYCIVVLVGHYVKWISTSAQQNEHTSNTGQAFGSSQGAWYS